MGAAVSTDIGSTTRDASLSLVLSGIHVRSSPYVRLMAPVVTQFEYLLAENTLIGGPMSFLELYGMVVLGVVVSIVLPLIRALVPTPKIDTVA